MRLSGRSCRALLVAAAILFGATTAEARDATIAAVVQSPAQFDGQTITLQGTVAAVTETTSRRGNDYTRFKLQDPAGTAVSVFTWGHPALSNGDRVEVEGVFQQVKQVGQYIFSNEVEAENVRPLRHD